MAIKICTVCDRRFSKLEHLKRHERSHTKEKPFTCPHCHKSFARSDVLCRHIKGHQHDSTNTGAAINRVPLSEQAEPSPQQPQRQQQTRSQQQRQQLQHHQALHPAAQPMDIDDELETIVVAFESGNNNAAMEGPVHRAGDSQQISTDDSIAGLNHDMQQGLHPDTHQTQIASGDPQVLTDTMLSQDSITTGANAGNNNLSDLMTFSNSVNTASTHWNHSASANNTGDGGGPMSTLDVPSDLRLAPDDTNLGLSQQASSHVVDHTDISAFTNASALPNLTAFSLPVTPQGQDDFSNLVSFWLYQPELDPVVHNSLRDIFGEPAHIGNLGLPLTPSQTDVHPSDPGSGNKVYGEIPRERFTRVQHLWHPESRKSHRGKRNLLMSILQSSRRNLVCSTDLAPHPMTTMTRARRLTQESRQRIEAMLASPSLSDFPSPALSRDFASQHTSQTEPELQPSKSTGLPTVPPVEILDVALDVYFGQFHPTLPIIHIPTFSLEHIPTSLLLAMCMVALNILGTTGAVHFVNKSFPTLLRIVSSEMHANAVGNAGVEASLTTMLTALVTLHVACVSGRRGRVMQVEPLYVQLLGFAQWHGLFSVTEETCLEEMFAGSAGVDVQWAAWSKLESLKRLTLGIIEIDCWFATCLSSDPYIDPGTVRILVPSTPKHFEAGTAQKWLHLQRNGSQSRHLAMTPGENLSLSQPSDPSILRCKLSLIHLRLCNAFHRLDAHDYKRTREPWRHYILNRQDGRIVDDLLKITSADNSALARADVDCAILWHHSCIMLASNIRLFETATGRNGADEAKEALDNISEWTETPAARRACLHAGEIYKTLMDRRLIDTVNMHTAVALFRAALVLGLFIFTGHTAESLQDEHVVNLTDKFDWVAIGSFGLTQEWNRPAARSDDENTDAAIKFIQNGGPFCISGHVNPYGYVTSRRVLLHFSDMMEGLGKWKSRTFSEILFVLSDNLMHVYREDEHV